ncbi:hypothetical protein P3X46_005421 [Hevea brasiliensis]|uniref:PSII 6.1 kDa protein n=1 Tax=Hevea brasiliensis TaxID=3981 RepID=A0ABQ9N132_HEVBR|nr:hypothetical protein P3X46_005421 [Hevea brasiliensis]
MATLTTSKLPTFFAPTSFNKTARIHSTPILEEARINNGINTSMVLSMMAAAATMAGPAVALVDERMSTEGKGLPFCLSNNLLGWILLGVFGLIWSFHAVYTSTLEEDDDSALSL